MNPLATVENRYRQAAKTYKGEFGEGWTSPVFYLNWPEGHPVRTHALAIGMAVRTALRSGCSEDEVRAAANRGMASSGRD